MLMPTIPEKLAAANAEGSALRHEETNPALIENVVKAVTALFPMASSDNKTRIEVSSVRVDTKGFDADALAKWQDARQQTKTIGGSILADLVLIRDDKVAQRLNGFRLGQLPLMGALGTFMTNGNDYFTPMQLRLKPGAYTREKTNGEYETFIPTKGANLKVYMDPATGVFKLEVFSSNVSWYALVRSLGTTDEQILDVWGNTQASRELLERNKVKNPDKDLEKFFKTIFEKKQNRDLIRAGIEKRDISLDSVDKAGQVTAVKTWMSSQKLDPYVTKKTLGEGLDSLSPQVLLQASRRIIEVSKNTHEPDDRDAIEFKTLHHVDDMLPERIKKLGRSLTRRLLMRLSKPGTTLAKGFGSNWLNPATVGFFGGSRGIEGGMANTAEAANPLAILSEHSKITLTGEGGIGSSRAITTDARLFRPGSSNFIDLVHTPEGAEIGISTHTAWNTRKRGNVLEALFLKVENGIAKTPVWISAELANDSIVSYPEYWNIEGDGKPNEKLVRANKKGAIELVPPSEVQYVIPSGRSMFDHTSNASIFFDATSANRGMMSGKHMTQALPLVNREHPLVTLVDGRGNSVMETLAKTFTIRSKVDGVVTKVTPTEIVIGNTVHEIFNQYAMQAKVALNHIAVVKVGDRVSKGQLIADSNYSKDGKLALGVNVHTAYMPWKGALNYEDAIVISESAAKKFSSEHVHREELELLPGITVDKKLAQAQFPTLFTADSFKKLEENGVIKEGSRIDPGQVLIAAVKKVEFDEHDRSSKNLSSIHKILQRPYRNASITWTEIFPATVYRVVRTAESITVHLTTHEPMQVGDKLSMSSAAKGTVSAIIADDKMPRTKKGEHIEVILSPHGVVGRVNPSQTLEQAAGKLVKITGKKYEATNFGNINLAKDISDKLDKAGISHEEVLFDPETGKDIEKPVGVGYNYMIKLDHAVRKKFSARERDGYTMDETPTRGKGVGGQSYDHLTTYALLGHNAHAILGESAGIRGTKHDEFWHAFQAGELPPPPKVPFVFEKFRAFLNAAGVDTQQRGNTLHYLPMSETRVRAQSNGEIKEGTLIKSKDLAEEKNGLFDPAITGGLTGDKFAHIELNERIPQPLYEKTIRDVLGLKTAEYYGLIAHTKFWNTVTKKFQDEASRDTLTGEEAFKNLMNFNIADKLEEAKRGLRTAVGSDANKLNRAARYLRGLQETKLTPFDAYMTKAVAVLPPKYRPIIEMSGGALRVADSNLMYRDVILTNDALAQAKAANMPADALATARTTLYQSVGALIGVNNALTHRDDREDAQGLIDTIKGKSNKTGMFQRLIVAHRNDYSGRSTIEPDANLGVDEIGIPEEMAWKIFKPMVVRRLSQLGNKPSEAMEAVEKRTLIARQALDEEMKNRPVLYNRAPSLHRWSIAASYAIISSGKELKISPLIVGPTSSDHDGDTMSITPTITEEARKESLKLLPSSNLLYDKDRSLAYGVGKDIISGIFALTKPGLPSGKSYESADAAIAAYHANKDSLLMGSLVTIAGKSPVAIGWLIFQKIVPARFLGSLTPPITGKKLDQLLTDIATKSPSDYNLISRQIVQAGFDAGAAAGGITSTIGELNVDRTKIDRLLNQMEHSIAAAGPDKTDRIAAAKKSYDAINPQLEEEVKSHLKTINRGYHSFIESGSNDKKVNQMMQMLASPVMMADIHDQIVPAVVKSSYAQGMRPSDYVLTTPGSRKGLVARSLSTALPGFLAKEVAGNVGDVRIYDKDCNTTRGIEEPLKAPNGLKDHDVDLLDRHLLRDIMGTSFKRNDPVTPGLLAQLRDKSVQTIWVRSPMTCQAAKPPCQMCAGRAPTGELWPIGTNIGYNYGQGISERSTQLTMKCSAGLITLATGEVYPFSEFFSRLKSVEEKDMRTAKDGIPALKGRKGEVKALSAQQHPPHDDVYLISTKTGSAMLVQGNHPLFVHPGRVRKNFSNRNLSLIGDERYRQTQAGTRDSNVAFHGELKEMQARDVSTENAIWVDYAPTVVRGTVTPSIDGYLAGYYASEGCIRYGNGTPKYKGVAVATCIALKGNTVIGLKNQARVEKALHGLSYGISGDAINIYSPSFASKIAALVGSHVMPRGVGQSPSNAKVLLGGFSNYTDQWLKDFLDGMIDGDGTIFESSGSTVAKICTTSFELATQIMFIARKFDLWSSISATDKSPCRLPQWNTAFNVELRFPKGYVSTSHRVEVIGGIKPMKRKMLRPIRGFDPVSQVKKLTQWRGFVYDVKTSTSEFMLGTIQNHNTFHAGGTVGAGDALMEGFNRLRELLSVPDVIKKQGTLATVNGRVEETRLAPQGGYFVYIGDKRVEHHVQQGRDLIVKNGDVVSAGDPLSTGNFKPQEIAEHKGTLAAQQYVVNQIRRSYQDAGAVVRKPVIEVLAAAMMRTVEVTNDGGEPDLAIGDVIHENDYENRKKRNQKITAKPTLLGLSHKPLQSKDLLARLNFQRLDDAIRDIPSAGGSSDLTGAGSPISGLAYGAAFRPEADSAFNAGVKY